MSGFPQYLPILKTTQKNSVQIPRCEDAEHGTITAYDKNARFSMTTGKKAAFTMAEVLITLMILGVIATVTIPALTKNIQKKDTVVKVQKAYKILSSAGMNIRSNSGANDVKDSGLLDLSDGDLDKEFAKLANMNVTQFYSNLNWQRAMYMYCEKQTCNGTKGGAFKHYFITADGFMWSVSPYGDFLNIMFFTDYKSKTFKRGRNTFYFIMYDNFRVEPLVANSNGTNFPLSWALQNKYSYTKPSNINYSCSVDTTTVVSGMGCAAKIMNDGWKMNY